MRLHHPIQDTVVAGDITDCVGVAVGIEHVEQSRELATCSSDIFAVSAMSGVTVRRVVAVCAA